jgi:YD repeat-containing protein
MTMLAALAILCSPPSHAATNPPVSEDENPACAEENKDCPSCQSPTASQSSGAETPPSTMSVGVESLHVGISLGQSLFEQALCPGSLMIRADVPTAALATPAALQATGAPAIIHDEDLGGGVRRVDYADRNGSIVTFNVESGIGLPQSENIARGLRLALGAQSGYEVHFDTGYTEIFPDTISESVTRSELGSVVYPDGRTMTPADAGIEVLRLNGEIRQVLFPGGAAQVQVLNDRAYYIHFYGPPTGQPDQEGMYNFSQATELATVAVANPNAGANYDTLRVGRVMGTRTEVWQFTYNANLQRWDLEEGYEPGVGGLRTRRVYQTDGASQDIFNKHFEVLENSTVKRNRIEVRQRFAWGDEVISEIEDPDGEARTTEFEYYTNPAGAGYGRIKSRENPDGSWERYEYDSEGRLSRTISGWLDGGIASTPSQSVEELYFYTPHTQYDTPSAGDRRPRTVIKKILGTEVARRYSAYAYQSDALTHTEEICTVQGAAFGAATSLKAITKHYASTADAWKAGRVEWILHPDGRKDEYEYDRGNFTWDENNAGATFSTSGSGKAHRTIITHGVDEQAPIDGRTLQEMEITDGLGRLCYQERLVWDEDQSTYVKTAWTYHEFNELGQKVSTLYSDGTQETWGWVEGQKTAHTNRTGIVTAFDYDGLGRLEEVVKEGYLGTYDA